MVDVKFLSRVQHFVPLAVLQKFIGNGLTPEQRKDVHYLSDDQVQSIKEMPLLMPGRLSVQVGNSGSVHDVPHVHLGVPLPACTASRIRRNRPDGRERWLSALDTRKRTKEREDKGYFGFNGRGE